jgi:hypothetical protein
MIYQIVTCLLSYFRTVYRELRLCSVYRLEFVIFTTEIVIALTETDDRDF